MIQNLRRTFTSQKFKKLIKNLKTKISKNWIIRGNLLNDTSDSNCGTI